MALRVMARAFSFETIHQVWQTADRWVGVQRAGREAPKPSIGSYLPEPSCVAQGAEGAVEERQLAGEDLDFGRVTVEVPGAIDLREALHLPGLRRPHHLERVAVDGGGVDAA